MNIRRDDELDNIQPVPTGGSDWRTNMVVLTAVLNIVTLLVFIFGGMNWITQVNAKLETTSRQIELTAQAVKNLQDWSAGIDKRHSAQDAIREYLETHPAYTPKQKPQ